LAFGLFAWQAGCVFTLRSAQLWAEPAKAQERLAAYALEKQRAFAQGMAAAGRASLAGADAPAVMAAALAPAQRRVRANARKLSRGR
jgi:hypothetical protein